MGLFNVLIAVLTIKILFLKVNIWHVNATSLVNDPSSSQSELKKDDAVETFNNSKRNKMISRNISQLVPNYNETYRYKPEWLPRLPLYQNKMRIKRKEGHMWLTCHEGYVISESDAMCVPRCPQSCQKGICKKPDVCTCFIGYRMSSNGSCVPQCTNGCVNGTCVKPEVCSCNEGYMLDSDGVTCRPVCNTECEENHGYCSEPNVCTCHSGYKKHRRFMHTFNSLCEPVCDRACINGLCAAPNVCVCADGYEKDKNDSFICKPKCDEPCVFGKCLAPGRCFCDYGYQRKNATVCRPICVEPCKMGTCVAINTCRCNEGYRHRNNSRSICEPICKEDCGSGICIAPDKCFHRGSHNVSTDKTNQSKPICTIPCGPNGECTSTNECTCFEGYRSHAHKIITELHENYSKTPSPEISVEKSVCQPVCNFTCYNGKCTAPNVCTCDPGYYPLWLHPDKDFHHYVSKSWGHFCLSRFGPPCNAHSCGDNATCHNETGICFCDDGYKKDTAGVCTPVCVQGCFGGVCTAPNHCECRDGYALQNNTYFAHLVQSSCEPICERGCQNGNCIGPNECICHDDFIPNTDHHSRPECIPVCARNCSGHGDCVISADRNDNYKCECHLGWTGLDCDQPTMCLVTMAYGHDDVKRIMIDRYDLNKTLIRAYEDAPYCHQCNNSLDNETLCHAMHLFMDYHYYKRNTFINCLISTDLPCYTMSRYNALSNVTVTVWPFVILAIFLVTGLTVATYFIYRKLQNKILGTAGTSTVYMRESLTENILLPAEI